MTQNRNKRLPLTAPITLGDQTLTEVSVKKPKVKDLKTLQDALAGIEDQLEQGILMAVVLTDLPREAIEDMDTDDFTAISEVIAGFFPKGHGIRDWRAVTAETAHWLNTSITDLMDMDWPELVLWHTEARRLARAAIPK